jgi:hypothetical protein
MKIPQRLNLRSDYFYRMDFLAPLFLILSVSGSFLGEYVYKLYGFYEAREYDHSTYFLIFLPFFILLILGFSFANRFGKARPINFSAEPGRSLTGEARLLALIMIAAFILFVPFQLIYLKMLYSEVSPLCSLDEARLKLQSSVPLAGRFFMYGSFLAGLACFLLLAEEEFRYGKLLKALMAVQFGLIFLYGSKFLIIIPIIGAYFTLFMHKKIRLALKNLLKYIVLFVIVLSLGTVYNNVRSAGQAKQSQFFLVDFFASFMPEQRDAAYLISTFGNAGLREDYLKDHIPVIITSLTNRTVYEFLTGEELAPILQGQSIYKEYLEYEFPGMARTGIIGDAYLSSGPKGAALMLAVYGAGLLLLYRLIYFRKRSFLDNYFLLLIFLNLLWTFNSSFIVNLPFIFYVFYFYLFFKAAFEVLRKISYSQ